MGSTKQERSEGLWFLEGLTHAEGELRRIPILVFPFTIGRRPELSLTLEATEISGRHAEFFREGRRIMLRDMDSTNGTFINGKRFRGECQVHKGDLINFARLEFRLGVVDSEDAESLLAQTIAVDTDLPDSMLDKGRILQELMKRRAVASAFQPIVHLSDRSLFGYEVLGRAEVDGATARLSELFGAAKILGAEAALSRLFRQRSAFDCSSLPSGTRLFINTHPKEMGTKDLVASLEEFRRIAPELKPVLEIHEAAVTDPEEMLELNQTLRSLGFQLAYDDFGAGQARLIELAEVPPDYLKFDISLIRAIDQASTAKHTILERMVSMALELGIVPIAEGVESEPEARICQGIGFALGQGYLFGTPAPADQIAGSPTATSTGESAGEPAGEPGGQSG